MIYSFIFSTARLQYLGGPLEGRDPQIETKRIALQHRIQNHHIFLAPPLVRPCSVIGWPQSLLCDWLPAALPRLLSVLHLRSEGKSDKSS